MKLKETKDQILKMTLDQLMSDRFARYSKYIIQNRALPDARDGLKPVQRRILFAMFKLGLTPNQSFKKSARVVGEVIGKYHPHGDSSIYEAMVRMSQSWKMNHTLINMHGNNGSVDDDPPAAMRYTETKLCDISNLLLTDINKDTVAFAPNFDDSETEPVVLPGLLPNLLINGAKGIAAGYATEIPPHNLAEVIDALVAKIRFPNISLDELMKHIKGPDFPTGAIVQGTEGIYDAFATGRGRIAIKSKYEVFSTSVNPRIVISEIPFGVVKSKLVKELDDIRLGEKVPNIKFVRDESDRNGVSVIIGLKSNQNVENTINYLLSKTEMLVYYNYNNIAICEQIPTQMNLHQMLDVYLKHQKNVQRKALEHDFARRKRKLEIVQGLLKASTNIAKIISLITNAANSKKGVVEALITNLQFTQVQANAIAELQLYRLSKTDQSVYLEEQKELQLQIKNLRNLLSNEKDFNNFLVAKLEAIQKNFGTKRKTLIEKEVQRTSFSVEKLIKKEPVWVGVTQNGYVKRFSKRTYESNSLNNYFVKEEDALVFLNQVQTTDKVLLFTNLGNFFNLPVSSFTEAKFKAIGTHINDFSMLKPAEKIVSVVSVSDLSLKLNLVFVTQNGKGKRVWLESFATSKNLKPRVAIKLNPNDFLVGVKPSNSFQKIVILTRSGKAVKYLESEVSLYNTKTSGHYVVKLGAQDKVQNFALVSEESVLGLITKTGKAKRIKVQSVLPFGKQTQGKFLYKNLKSGFSDVIAMETVSPGTEFFSTLTSREVISSDFRKIDITSQEEGFSKLVNKPLAWAFIQNPLVLLGSENGLLNQSGLSEGEKFQEAEDKIKKVTQISIDEIMKK